MRRVRGRVGRGRMMVLLETTTEVIRAERVLKAAGLAVEVAAPPPAVRSGCDMAIAFDALLLPRVLGVVGGEGLEVVGVVDMQGRELRGLRLVRRKDMGRWIMLQVGNMKLTVDFPSRRVVNVSGGGCPDVPALAAELVGAGLKDGPWPAGEPLSLCGYALARAWDEAVRLCCG